MDDPYPLSPRLQAMLEALPLAELAFAPVPVRARPDGWTPARQIAFVHRLALCGSVATRLRALHAVSSLSSFGLPQSAGDVP